MPSDPKQIVTRLIEDVINDGDLDLIDQFYAPEMAAAARGWITPF